VENETYFMSSTGFLLSLTDFDRLDHEDEGTTIITFRHGGHIAKHLSSEGKNYFTPQ
jgi:hypothetical protein